MGGASGQNIENTEVKALSGIFAYTASALTIICYLSFRVKVGCHMTTRKSFGPMPPLIQLRRAQLFSWVRSSIEICCWRQARSKAGPRVSSAPSGLVHFSARQSHGLRRGLHSFAASRLREGHLNTGEPADSFTPRAAGPWDQSTVRDGQESRWPAGLATTSLALHPPTLRDRGEWPDRR